MSEPWRNWSGSIAFQPERFERPRDAVELARIVRAAHQRGGYVRVVGTGHSSSEILIGEDTLVSLEHLRGVVSADRAACEAIVLSGSTLVEPGAALYEHDLALPNYGDIATQTIGRAVGTRSGRTGSGWRRDACATCGSTT